MRSVVTGGTGAVGKAIIAAMKARGDDVVCLDLRRPEQTDVKYIKVDISDRASVNAAFEQAAQTLGGIDALVHSAGIITTAQFCNLDEADFRRVVDVNLLGTFRVAQESCRYMTEHGGRIVFVTSIHGQIGVPGRSAYAAAKGGIASLARVMAAELAERRIRVNVLAPGAVDGGMLVDPRSREGWVKATPSRRVACLEEIAGVAAMLTSENASFITGQIVAVDGGVSTIRAFSHESKEKQKL
ncbi:SDR family NAD(P)-dependent oxidoreductase [uncultured Tateyamaria sp.]|uniref:SDR family NAD(P)-dependent oxidoreductase n=1 Tax=uncultured Tateyamaria sp. TaxID=455651 RepID=UPI0026265926|nr:SDR family NAD(P)-dependent oxidoreductase [uncultured Tateyamaria sp.]